MDKLTEEQRVWAGISSEGWWGNEVQVRRGWSRPGICRTIEMWEQVCGWVGESGDKERRSSLNTSGGMEGKKLIKRPGESKHWGDRLWQLLVFVHELIPPYDRVLLLCLWPEVESNIDFFYSQNRLTCPLTILLTWVMWQGKGQHRCVTHESACFHQAGQQEVALASDSIRLGSEAYNKGRETSDSPCMCLSLETQRKWEYPLTGNHIISTQFFHKISMRLYSWIYVFNNTRICDKAKAHCVHIYLVQTHIQHENEQLEELCFSFFSVNSSEQRNEMPCSIVLQWSRLSPPNNGNWIESLVVTGTLCLTFGLALAQLGWNCNELLWSFLSWGKGEVRSHKTTYYRANSHISDFILYIHQVV